MSGQQFTYWLCSRVRHSVRAVGSRFSTSGARGVRGSTRRAGFTMIELILVMTILTIALSITAPALANFFRGRSLDSEARRLLALTRSGQSRAVSEGIPIDLWIDSAQGSFGLEAEPSYEPEDPKAVEFTLDGMQIEALNGDPASGATSPGTLPLVSTQPNPKLVTKHSGLPHIRFLPDGSIAESSPQVVRLTGRDRFSLDLAQARNRLNYELRTRNN